MIPTFTNVGFFKGGLWLRWSQTPQRFSCHTSFEEWASHWTFGSFFFDKTSRWNSSRGSNVELSCYKCMVSSTFKLIPLLFVPATLLLASLLDPAGLFAAVVLHAALFQWQGPIFIGFLRSSPLVGCSVSFCSSILVMGFFILTMVMSTLLVLWWLLVLLMWSQT